MSQPNPETNETQPTVSAATPAPAPESVPEVRRAFTPPDAERVIPLAELKEETEYDAEEAAFMTKLYDDTLREIKSGEIVTGRIVSISDKDVAIDIGFKSEGTVSIEEFSDPTSLNIGDTIEVFLESIEDQEGALVLSKKRADFTRVWERILDQYQRGENVPGKCMRRIKGGIVVDVMGVEAFLPGSQIDIHPVRDFDAWIGQTCDFRIVKVNEMRKNIVLSRKVLIEENLRDVREKILSEIQIGQVLDGQVKNITDFGAFVDLGGVDGLLHITDLSWGRVNHPSELVSYDQKIKVRILDFDPVRKRISIGLKQLQPHPWEGIESRFPLSSKVKGKVVSLTKYGAFVELEEGIEGLIHISEMSWTQHIKHPAQLLSIGQDVDVVVLSMDAENRKISLGLKQTEEDPWEKLEQKYALGTKHLGVVRDLVPFGAFVELEEGIEGLVHISDLSWTRKIKHPGEIVKKGDHIDVVIISFDRNERRIALGHKQTLENPWELFAAQYPAGSIVEAKIARSVDKGAVIELPLSLEGFLPVSQFGKDPKTGRAKAIKEGEPLKVEILEFDKENKKIILSAATIQKREEEAEYQAYLTQQTPPAEAPVAETPELVETAPETEAAPKPEAEEAPKLEAEEAPKLEAEEAPKLETEEAPKPEAEEPPKEAKPKKSRVKKTVEKSLTGAEEGARVETPEEGGTPTETPPAEETASSAAPETAEPAPKKKRTKSASAAKVQPPEDVPEQPEGGGAES